jgi:hypothetical protein
MLVNLLTNFLIVGLLVSFGMVVFPLAMPFAPLYAKLILALYFVLILGAVFFSSRRTRRPGIR